VQPRLYAADLIAELTNRRNLVMAIWRRVNHQTPNDHRYVFILSQLGAIARLVHFLIMMTMWTMMVAAVKN